MKVISHKSGSTRDRIDAEAILLTEPSWQISNNCSYLILYSQWGTSERAVELWLTEGEALGIAKKVSESVFNTAIKSANTATKKE